QAGEFLALLRGELDRLRRRGGGFGRRRGGRAFRRLRRRQSEAEEFFGQLAGPDHRMGLDEVDERADALGKGLAGDAEFALHRADVAHALGAFLENGETLTTESPAEAIGGVERKTALAFELALDGAADFAGREKLERFAVKTGMLDRTEDLFAGLGKEVGPGFLQR